MLHNWQYTQFDSYGNLTEQRNTRYYGSSSSTMVEKFGHDGRGNLTHRNNTHEITYNGMNKPTWINRHGSAVNLYYGADEMRYKQVRTVSGSTTTTHYIDKLFEVEIKGSTKTYSSYGAKLSHYSLALMAGLALIHLQKKI